VGGPLLPKQTRQIAKPRGIDEGEPRDGDRWRHRVMTARLTLVCHASTLAVRASAFPADEPIDAQGMRQLASFPHRMSGADLYLTSPMLRAVQTAKALNFAATADGALRDADYGRWAGRSFDDVQAAEPEAVAEWLQNPETAPHGGESLFDLMARVKLWLDGRNAASGATVAITHAAIIRAAISLALEAGPMSFWRIDIAPLSLTRLNGDGKRWTLVSLNARREPVSELQA
jgi:broad specificity phosphatase PhoE